MPLRPRRAPSELWEPFEDGRVVVGFPSGGGTTKLPAHSRPPRKLGRGFSTLECGRGFEAHHTRRKRGPVSHSVFRTGHQRVPIETFPESEPAHVDGVDTIAWDQQPVYRSPPIQA